MAPPVKIRLASRAYDGIVPILRGQMGIPGFDLDIIETEDVPAMFAGIALRKDLAKRHPELPEELFWLFSESKAWAQRWRRAIPSLVEAWLNETLNEEGKVFETDPWAYGLEANRHVLNKFLLYCHAQGISARNLAPEELFHSSTVNLTE